MSNWRKEWLTFDRKDRVAIPFLFFLIILLIVALTYWDEWNQKSFNENNTEVLLLESTDSSSTNDHLKQNDLNDLDENKVKKNQNSEQFSSSSIYYFEFDPNKISVDSFSMLGFSKKEAQAFINFRASGMVFKSPEDLQQSFVVTNKDFERLRDYIVIGRSPKKEEVKNYSKNKFEGVIELNAAKKEELEMLYGIGPTYAQRMIKFRDALGGFVDKRQVNEVYGIEDSTFLMVKSNIKVDPTLVVKIDINSATKKQLSRHPYIEYHVANSIVNYRQQHGSFNNLEEIKNLHLIDEKLYAKIKLYLEVK